MQLAAVVDSRRLVVTAGNFSALDIFDRNNTVGDLRQTFFNEAFITHASWDFPADARGYTYGAAAELYLDDWAIRIGRFAPPAEPNSYPLEVRIWKYYGDELAIEHDHRLAGLPGAVRFLAYRNYEVMGRFEDAIAAWQRDPTKNAASCTTYNYGSGNFLAPDLCWVRRPQAKVGIGVNVEQAVAEGIGLFARAMYSDGRTEVDAFDSADRDVSLTSRKDGSGEGHSTSRGSPSRQRGSLTRTRATWRSEASTPSSETGGSTDLPPRSSSSSSTL